MKRASTSTIFSAEEIVAALAAAPDRVNDPDTPYDPNDPEAVAAFWSRGKVRRPGERGPQKRPVKEAVTIRFDAEVVAYFKAAGAGWQTRINDVLRRWVADQDTEAPRKAESSSRR